MSSTPFTSRPAAAPSAPATVNTPRNSNASRHSSRALGIRIEIGCGLLSSLANADPETTDKGQSGICVQASADGYQCPGWIKSCKWGPKAPLNSPPVLERVASPARQGSAAFKDGTNFPYYQLGSGGNLDVFDPPQSFWGMVRDSRQCLSLALPLSFFVKAVPLACGPHLQAHPEAGALWNWLTSATYTAANVTGVSVAPDPTNPPIVQAFHGGHWGGWTFEVNGSKTNTVRRPQISDNPCLFVAFPSPCFQFEGL